MRAWLAVIAVLAGIGISFAADTHSILQNDKRWEQARKNLAQGNAAEARGQFEELLKVYPDDSDLHLFMGMALLRLRDPQAAIVEAKRAIEIRPDHVDARTFLAWIELEVRGNVDAAIKEYQKAIELHPELPDAYSNLAVAQKRRGNLDQAVASLNKGLELKPDFATALTTRGGIFAEQNRWTDPPRGCE